MRAGAVGIDTSSYTTSVAFACQTEGLAEGIVFEERTVLSVPLGGRGLRQSDACFQHVRNLPQLTDALFAAVDPASISAVAVSARPTDAPDSYMPVFLAGRTAAKAIAGALRVPLVETTHQRGHIRAALIGNEALFGRERIAALHLSGGTTDLLSVETSGGALGEVRCFGRSTDLHAGQLVDRVGVALGLPFPAGPALEKLAASAGDSGLRVPASVSGTDCSFSGAESQLQRCIAAGEAPGRVAYAVYDLLARTVEKLLRNACAKQSFSALLLCGGVTSSPLFNALLRARCDLPLYSAQPRFASDNAAGAALLGLAHSEKRA